MIVLDFICSTYESESIVRNHAKLVKILYSVLEVQSGDVDD